MDKREAPTINCEALELLGELYAVTGDDWLLEVDTIITEPVCPMCTIRAETDKTQPDFRRIGDSIGEAINSAAEAAIEHFGLRARQGTSDHE